MIRLGIVERYVLQHTLRALGVALLVISAVIALVDFVELSRDVGARADLGFGALLGLTLMKSPSTILTLLPFAFLFGTLGAFVTLNRRSELIAMRAAGVSAWRFIFPAAGAAFAIGVLTVVALNPAAAWLNTQFETGRSRALDNYLTDAPREVWLRQGDGRTYTVIRAQSRRVDEGTVTLNGVSLFIYTANAQGAQRFSRRIEAEQARLIGGRWVLSGAREASPGAVAVRYDQLSLPTNISGRAAMERAAGPLEVPFWRLPFVIGQLERSGFASTAYRLQLDQLLATPVLFAAMTVLAAAFSLRLIRMGGLAAMTAAGVTLGFAFFFFNALCGALGGADILPTAAAAWAPPLVALLSGFTLLVYTEDG